MQNSIIIFIASFLIFEAIRWDVTLKKLSQAVTQQTISKTAKAICWEIKFSIINTLKILGFCVLLVIYLLGMVFAIVNPSELLILIFLVFGLFLGWFSNIVMKNVCHVRNLSNKEKRIRSFSYVFFVLLCATFAAIYWCYGI